MSYIAWKNALMGTATDADRSRAQVWNLDNQQHAKPVVDEFKEKVLGAAYARMLAHPTGANPPAEEALTEAIKSLRYPSPWLGKDPVGPGASLGIPQEVLT